MNTLKIKIPFLSNNYLQLTARAVLGIIFIFAGIEKISNPEQFAIAISNYKLLPIFSLNLIAITLPWLEVVSGILLLFGIAIKENSAIIGALMVSFTIMVIIAVLRGLDIDCGCFGTSDGEKVGLLKIIENIGLIVLSIYIYFFDKKSFSIETK